jgi:hypothetical protein
MMGYWGMWGPWVLIPLVILFIMLGPMRHVWWSSRRRQGRDELQPPHSSRMEGLEVREQQRQHEIEQLESRVAELEARLDFAERLVTRTGESQDLPRDPGRANQL